MTENTQTVNTAPSATTSSVVPPFIQKKIDGRVFTVILHFATDTNETIYDKLGRVFLHDLESGKLKNL